MKLLTKLSLFISLCLLASCGNAPKTETTTSTNFEEMVLPHDFVDFLDEFHGSEEFQMNHIRFPMQGLPSMMADSVDTETFRWTVENWVIHQGFDLDNEEFEQTFKLFGDDMIVEHIIHINGQTGMERRFSRSGESWDLIYYAAMNFIKK